MVILLELDLRKLEKLIFEKMAKTHLPGLSISIVHNGTMIYSKGFGFRDVERGYHATPSTLYAIGSVTKSFTSLAIMQLANQRKLDLEDPAEKYLPIELRAKGEKIKIWHLLTHTSGIPALAYAEALINYVTESDNRWIPIASYEDLFTFIKDSQYWAIAKPGERWLYLNEGYLVLGYIIEKVSGIDYRSYVYKNILEPLRMSRTFFEKEMLDKDHDAAVPYIITKDGRHIRSCYLYSLPSDGGLISNVVDLCRYISMYISRGQYMGKTIASPEVIEEMEKPRISVPLQIFGKESYGYGFRVIPEFFGHKLVGHSGSVLTATAYVGYIPDARLGVAILANGNGYKLSHMGLFALALMLGKDPYRLPFIKMESELEKLEGIYETYKGTMSVSVRVNGNFLNIEFRNKFKDQVVTLVPINVEGNVKKFFTLQDSGKIEVEFIIDDDRVDMVYERYRMRKVSRI